VVVGGGDDDGGAEGVVVVLLLLLVSVDDEKIAPSTAVLAVAAGIAFGGPVEVEVSVSCVYSLLVFSRRYY
jgi:hypothetical protein